MRLFCLIISLVTFIAGCSPAPSDTYIEYQQRLANVMEKSAATSTALTPFNAKHIARPSSKITLSMLELASLDHCTLMNTIASNNNQLGKVRVPSEQLKYALRFIKHVEICLNNSATKDAEIKNKLTTALNEKKRQLPSYFEQMVYNERELAKMSLLTSQEIDFEDHKVPLSKALEALSTLSKLQQLISQPNLNYWQHTDPNLITDALAKLNNNHAISRLITSARTQIMLNRVTTEWLNTINPSEQICQSNKNKQKAQILSNVFNRFYLSQLQGYQSKLTNMLQNASPALVILWQSDDAFSKLFDIEHSGSYYQQLKISAVEHVTWWQKFYKACKIQP
ncbi:hypothetical protein PSECIP111951_02525 [Pseudoalteromonas holothuriae]|uniref:DUF3080 domain-containing protein n=1 Tax=Pseudoalteromonas holothuriae TaxID=2963714 RepID=A0ABM9GKP4_9GAMM|nr:DUF3080 domain-containing protein [Pseudoalteromonas sp. CIP111951]CAH9061613.1 hypothetical protein PSECIP111951_02525 [Pseudoalteromonas sp. CIP111951]